MGYLLPLINLAINIHIIFGIFTLQLLYMFLERFKVRISLDSSKKKTQRKKYPDIFGLKRISSSSKYQKVISKPKVVLTYNFLARIFRCDGNPASWTLIIVLQPHFNTNGTEDMVVDTDDWVTDLLVLRGKKRN